MSRLWFSDELVVKVKKPLRTAFLDFSTTVLREHACRREVDLNRRLAPDAYLGVAHVPSGDGAWEPAVVMQRQPSEWKLERLARHRQDLSVAVAAVVEVLAEFHRHATRSPEIDRAAEPAELWAKWQRNVNEMRQARPAYVAGTRLDGLDALARRYLDGREALLQMRITSGRICDGHGDLLAADIFCQPGHRPQILDCLEFDDALRYGDVLADVSFLAMDLERCGRPEAAELLLAEYQQRVGDRWPASLAHYYIAYRALIRAKVAGMRVGQGDPGAACLVEDHVAVAERHLHEGAVRLVLVGGLPGTGKTTLGKALAAQLGWRYLSSDVRRKELVGAPPDRPLPAEFGAGLYDGRRKDATYTSLIGSAEHAMALGESVVLDATWASTAHRALAQRSAAASGAEVTCLQTVLSDAEAEARLRARQARGSDASDADVSVARELRHRFEPWPAHRIDTSGPPSRAVEEAVRAVLGSPQAMR